MCILHFGIFRSVVRLLLPFSSGKIPTNTPNILFDIIDSDNDGSISVHENAVFFQISNLDLKYVPEAFQAIDNDKNGVISRDEFVAAYEEYSRGTDESHPSRLMFGPL